MFIFCIYFHTALFLPQIRNQQFGIFLKNNWVGIICLMIIGLIPIWSTMLMPHTHIYTLWQKYLLWARDSPFGHKSEFDSPLVTHIFMSLSCSGNLSCHCKTIYIYIYISNKSRTELERVTNFNEPIPLYIYIYIHI